MKGLSGAILKMWVVTNGTTPLSSKATPTPSAVNIKTAFLNLKTYPGSRLERDAGKGFACCVLLENPVGENRLTYNQLVQEVCERERERERGGGGEEV